MFRLRTLLIASGLMSMALVSIACSSNPDEGTDSTSAAVSSVGGTISRTEVISRAKDWVGNSAIPYNEGGYYPDPEGRDYREDCSGFVSMALHLSSSLSTVTLPDVSTKITKDDLEAGDMLGIMGPSTGGAGGHVMLFVGWTSSAHTSANVYEHGGGSGADAHPHASTYTWTWLQTGDSRGPYLPYRYTKISGTSSKSSGSSSGGGSTASTSCKLDGKTWAMNTCTENLQCDDGKWVDRYNDPTACRTGILASGECLLDTGASVVKNKCIGDLQCDNGEWVDRFNDPSACIW
jgi:hypothetical protein